MKWEGILKEKQFSLFPLCFYVGGKLWVLSLLLLLNRESNCAVISVVSVCIFLYWPFLESHLDTLRRQFKVSCVLSWCLVHVLPPVMFSAVAFVVVNTVICSVCLPRPRGGRDSSVSHACHSPVQQLWALSAWGSWGLSGMVHGKRLESGWYRALDTGQSASSWCLRRRRAAWRQHLTCVL